MSRRRLTQQDLAALAAQGGWRATEALLERTFRFGTYPDGVGFVTALALVAERRDHHPDIFLGWGRVRVTWSTHDAGGTTELDRELAAETDSLARRHGGEPE
ncbi:MAG: 4a-hydroxytetrahydrobiopterin dehydratase [Myxococcales bacterium]|nr:4a-hydroxytetrahydrobiopterin dehydratase [Myxococcales bacterium]